MLEPVLVETPTGKAEVRKVFALSSGVVAGSFVLDGAIARDNRARVVRGGQVVFDGHVQSLRRVKDEAREVRAGFECGITLRDFEEYQEGDRIEAYKVEQQKAVVPKK